MKKRIINFSKKYKLEIILISISLIYYLYFSNKGIVLYDEGYYVHVAERILQGEIPYKDFALQYTPGYFYVLAAFFRIFGEQLYVGRILSMLFCIGIIIMVFAILNKVRVRSTLIKILSFLAIVAFGYPLMNIPIIAWAGVFIVTGIMYCVISYSKEKRVENKTNIIIVLGCLLALLLLFKQNLGAVYVLLVNGILLLKSGETFRNKIKHLLIINGFFAVISFFWITYFFLIDNMNGLVEFISFSQKFSKSYSFSLPPLSLLLQPTGVFKLLPYYLPFIFFFAVVIAFFNKKRDWIKISCALLALAGFFATIYPGSDLLHVYPFLGIVLVSFLIFFKDSQLKIYSTIIVSILILTGFYLTLFGKHYRYEEPYSWYDTPLNFPRTHGMIVYKEMAQDLERVSAFIEMNTQDNKHVFVYPFAPALYFVLDIKNPSGDSIYYPRESASVYEEARVLQEIREKEVKYIITSGWYQYNTDLSKYIQKQKLIETFGRFRIFEIL